MLEFHRAPLLSFTKELPLHRYPHRASTPRDSPAFTFSSLSIGRYHRANLFRPRRFSRPRRFTPHGALQVYCTLQPVMGSARFLFLTSSPSDRPKPVRLPAIPRLLPKQSSRSAERLSTFPVHSPKTMHRSRESSREGTKSSPSGASTLRSFPLRLRCTRVTISLCVTTSRYVTAWPTLLVVAWCVLIPRSTGPVSGSDFPWLPGHLTQPQGLEPSPSPLHRYAVSDLSMPVAPLGLSDTGSPVPWHCAFVSEIENQPSDRNPAGRSNIDGREPKFSSSPKAGPRALDIPTSSR